MNSTNAKDYLPLVQALAEGKVIQGKYLDGWEDLSVVSFDMESSFYRIKPEPREIWVNRHTDGRNGSCWYDTEEECGKDVMIGWYPVRYREVIE